MESRDKALQNQKRGTGRNEILRKQPSQRKHQPNRAGQILASSPILHRGLKRCRRVDPRTFRALLAKPGRETTTRRLAAVWLEGIARRLEDLVYGNGLIEGLERRAERLRDEASKENLRRGYKMLDRTIALKRMEPTLSATPHINAFLESSEIGMIHDPMTYGRNSDPIWKECADALDEITQLTGLQQGTTTVAALCDELVASRSSRQRHRPLVINKKPGRRPASSSQSTYEMRQPRPESKDPIHIPASDVSERISCDVRIGQVNAEFSVSREVSDLIQKFMRDHGSAAIRHIGFVVAVRIATLRGGHVLTEGSRSRGGSIRITRKVEITLPGGPWTDGFFDHENRNAFVDVTKRGAAEGLEIIAMTVRTTPNKTSAESSVYEAQTDTDRKQIKPKKTTTRQPAPRHQARRSTGRRGYLTMTAAARRIGAGRTKFGWWLQSAGYLDRSGRPTTKGLKVSNEIEPGRPRWDANFVNSLIKQSKRIESAVNPQKRGTKKISRRRRSH